MKVKGPASIRTYTLELASTSVLMLLVLGPFKIWLQTKYNNFFTITYIIEYSFERAWALGKNFYSNKYLNSHKDKNPLCVHQMLLQPYKSEIITVLHTAVGRDPEGPPTTCFLQNNTGARRIQYHSLCRTSEQQRLVFITGNSYKKAKHRSCFMLDYCTGLEGLRTRRFKVRMCIPLIFRQ